ncbi:MAG TPA: hypothetical protein VNH64_02075, partial [Parvularculaceae bacterium]|nr:hypothetical protein [Parvularculaceae bacterium]
ARQATRYRNISGDIRRAEAMACYLRWRDAVEARDGAADNLRDIADLIEKTARAAASASTAQTEAHEALDPLRKSEAEAAAALHRLSIARDNLDEDARRAAGELRRLSEEIERLKNDGAREKELLADAEETVETLSREEENLKEREAGESERLREASLVMAETADKAAEAERAFSAKSAEAAETDARRRAIAAAADEAERRLLKISAQINDLAAERARVEPSPEQAAALADAKARFTTREDAARGAETAFQQSGEERASAESQEAALRIPRQKAAQRLAEIAAERDAIERILSAHSNGDWPALIETVDVDPGYENALAAALGDDLSAALDDSAPAHWSSLGAEGLVGAAGLPGGAAPLSRFVRAPAALSRRLAGIGVVEIRRPLALGWICRPRRSENGRGRPARAAQSPCRAPKRFRRR